MSEELNVPFGELVEEAHQDLPPPEPVDVTFSSEQIAEFAFSCRESYLEHISEIGPWGWKSLSESEQKEEVEKVNAVIQSAADPNYHNFARKEHDIWLVKQLKAGAQYDAVSNPLLLPYAAIPEHEKVKDFLFRNVVLSLLPIWSGK